MRIWTFLTALLAVLALMIPLISVQMRSMMRPVHGTIQAADISSESMSAQNPFPTPNETDAASKLPLVLPTVTMEGRKTFSIFNRSTGKLEQIDAIKYIRGAVASEMPATFHSEALAAQAVAAHTWALYNVKWQETHPDPTLKGGDFSADPLHDEGYVSEARFRERYGSQAELYWPKICAAADYAAHYVLTWEGEPALAVYHAMSAGSTEASDNVWETALPYLVSVKSEGDTLSPDYCSSHTWLLDEMHALLKAAFPAARLEGDPEKWLTVLARSEAGYVTLFSVGGVQVPGQQVRKALSLRSTCLLIEYANGTFSIETKGYGHGVGLSQNGADFLARQGSDAADILAHYYPGTTLTIVTTSDAAA